MWIIRGQTNNPDLSLLSSLTLRKQVASPSLPQWCRVRRRRASWEPRAAASWSTSLPRRWLLYTSPNYTPENTLTLTVKGASDAFRRARTTPILRWTFCTLEISTYLLLYRYTKRKISFYNAKMCLTNGREWLSELLSKHGNKETWEMWIVTKVIKLYLFNIICYRSYILLIFLPHTLVIMESRIEM